MCMYAYMYVYVYVCMCVYMCICIRVYTYIYIYVYVYMCMCTYIYMYSYMYAYVCIHICTYIYIGLYIYIYIAKHPFIAHMCSDLTELSKGIVALGFLMKSIPRPFNAFPTTKLLSWAVVNDQFCICLHTYHEKVMSKENTLVFYVDLMALRRP